MWRVAGGKYLPAARNTKLFKEPVFNHHFIPSTLQLALYEETMRFLLIEDEYDLAHALQRGLRQQGYAVDAAYNGEAGWLQAETNAYDLLILDLNLPGMDGLELCRKLRQSQPQLLILMLTARDQPQDRITGLDTGADDYLVKPFHFGELTARIRALLRRDLRVRSPLLQQGQLKLDPAARIAWQNNRPLDLTPKELAILEYFLRRPGEIVSQEDLLEHVWDDQVNPFTNVVRVHINSLRRKLGDTANNPHTLETITGLGYRLIAAPEES
jgi:DNA-binding response OmpR family regulator